MTIQEQRAILLKGIADLRKKFAEQEELVRQLEEQALLMAQGINPEEVAYFQYDPKLDKRRVTERTAQPNIVVMKDGSRIVLNPS